MDIYSMESSSGVSTLFTTSHSLEAAIKVGRVNLVSGQRVPSEGASSHAADEVSVILKGTLRVNSGGREYVVAAGDVTVIPAGEAHDATAESDVEICWVWFGNADSV